MEVKIHFIVPDNSAEETLWAECRENGLCVLKNIPMFIFNISLGDVFEVQEIDGILYFKSLVKHSGNSTFRIVKKEGYKNGGKELLDGIYAKGAVTESFKTESNMIAINVPSNKHTDEIKHALDQGYEKGYWFIEDGHVYVK